ncbi:hypothetical protein JZ751_025632 [Albula glossodonta]|uniref:Uncharacterized protein n=1 Tax=Albula glossodonta TaxID=121402 RepID=A0A8T2NF03_9TELE|nr:hypothetical protein JZ751_025632 [Albula glossodonta]
MSEARRRRRAAFGREEFPIFQRERSKKRLSRLSFHEPRQRRRRTFNTAARGRSIVTEVGGSKEEEPHIDSLYRGVDKASEWSRRRPLRFHLREGIGHFAGGFTQCT